MRTAVCLSGQFRFVEDCYSLIHEKIIAPNHADVFMHGWYSDALVDQIFTEQDKNSTLYRGILKRDINIKALKLYKPVKYLIEDQKDFSDDLKNINIAPYLTPALNQFSMFYSIYQSNEQKKNHEQENGFKYDAVIRCRYDFMPGKDYLSAEYDLNYINAKNDCLHTSYCINDHFAISNSTNMDVYSDTINHIKRYYFDNKEPFCPEILLGYGLRYDQARKLPIKLHNWPNRIKYDKVNCI